ncbi:MAG: hypothetical protein AAF492_02630, partial [Verrucomicrobiota bacterium]
MKNRFHLAHLLLAGYLAASVQAQSDYYTYTELPVPEGVVLEVSGITMMPGHVLAVSSRRGDIYTVKNPFGPPEEMVWKLYAGGLHEPLGIHYRKGWLYATQRCEVSRLKDEDGDGRADLFETVNDDWGINGDYHEYTFGAFGPDGAVWNVLCLTGSGGYSSDFRGWCLRVTPDGEMIPTASGVRSPGGIGMNKAGDMFYSDNQGPWNGTSSIMDIKIGSFTGYPSGNKAYALTDAIGPRPADPKSGSRIHIERDRIPEFVPPTILFTHGKMGNSTAGITFDSSEGKFGPFKDQLLVTDQSFSIINRCFLDLVNGVYLGAAFPFLSGFASGSLVMYMAEDGSLFTGGTNRGWGSRGRKSFALERVNWTGKVPFEVHEMRAKPDGFELTFTEPVHAATAGNPASYSMTAYTYIYQSGYGSPVVDRSTPKIIEARVGADKKSVYLKIDGLVRGHVHELHMPGVSTADGRPL